MELLSPLRPETRRSLLLGSGVLMEGFIPGPGLDAAGAAEAFRRAAAEGGRVLGCTEGGCFEVLRRFAQVRLAGQTGPCDLTAVPVWTEAALSGRLTEVSRENLGRLLSMRPRWHGNGGTALGLSLTAPPACLDSLCWLGQLAEGGQLLICLRRAVNLDSPRLEPHPDGHATVTFRFVAQDTLTGPESGTVEAPFSVWHLEGE